VKGSARRVPGDGGTPTAPPSKGAPRFVKDAVRVFGGQVAMTGIGMMTGIITARWLGPHDRGLFQLLTLLPMTLSNFVKLGIPQASVYFMRRKARPRRRWRRTAWFAFTTGTALAVVCWVWRDWLLAKVLQSCPENLIAPTLALIPFALLQFYLLGVAQAQERFHEYNIRQIVPNLLSLVGMFVVLVVLRMGLVGAVLTQAAIVVFMSLWLTVRVHREAPLHARVDGELLRGMLGFGSKSYVQTLAATLHLRIDQYLIAYLLGSPGEVAFYAIGVNLVSLLSRSPTRPARSSSPPRGLRAARRACRHGARLPEHALPDRPRRRQLAVGTDRDPASSAGHTGRPRDPPMLILPPGALMTLYQILARGASASHAKQEINIFAAVVALCLNVGLNLVLIPRFGIEGAWRSRTDFYGRRR
jgi:O-antigen/teichoic acid export membrane protein